jgi:hypothetical protein
MQAIQYLSRIMTTHAGNEILPPDKPLVTPVVLGDDVLKPLKTLTAR